MSRSVDIAAVDLFCGGGGLTHGLVRAGINVVAGIDSDEAGRFPFEANNAARFIKQDVAVLSPQALRKLYPKGSTKVLVGCAPCQPFSKYSRKPAGRSRSWPLLEKFADLAIALKPAVVSMENVPGLSLHPGFDRFVKRLVLGGFHVTFSKVFCPDYGIPQQRTRLVLFASRRSPISLPPPTHSSDNYVSVRTAIGKLPKLKHGNCDFRDPMHRACELSSLNLQRIQVATPGGNWGLWPSQLLAPCHRKVTGKFYKSVYGRMEWDSPAPTITTQFFGFGNGRFGHPIEDRALSLREGALLQTFPLNYKFFDKKVPSFAMLGKLIGNAVPVKLGELIGRTIQDHLGAL